jgi:hypothetical protein
MWEEELHIAPEERFGFWIRVVKVVILQCILFGTIAMLFNDRPMYFFEECEKRAECL